MAELAHLLAPLNLVLFQLGNDHVSVAELLGFVTGAASVWLTVLARISNFPVGIANSAFFLVLFLAARLYADSGLQAVYIVLGFTGWWQWLHGGQRRSRLTVTRSAPWLLGGCVLFVAAATWGLTVLLRTANDVAPLWDGLTTAISLAAQFLLNCKKIENWALWIMADLVYIPLYVVKRLDLTAIVYVLFLAMCLLGVAAWGRALRETTARQPALRDHSPAASPSRRLPRRCRMSGRYSHGLVVGKFYPPHLGHRHLIETAARCSAAVTVLVMAARRESVPLSDRVAWLRADLASHPEVTVCGVPCDIPVDFADPLVWEAQVAVMRAALRRDGRPPVDAVFASEPYGPQLAARFDAAPVSVDTKRLAVPISGQQIRTDVAGCWDYLSPAARAGLATRVVVVGAESTGTTTIARLLAENYRSGGGVWARTRCVSEAGRAYTVTKWEQARTAAPAGGPGPALEDLVWVPADFDAVAAEQTRRENEAAAAGSPLLVCDTDAFATSVWERRYLAGRARGLQPWATTGLPRHDLYLLTSHEGVPWRDDGLREGDLAVRAAMTGWFADALTAAGHSWLLLTGSLAERLALAVRATTDVLAHRMRFGPAITGPAANPAGTATGGGR